MKEFRNFADEWATFPLDLSAAGRMSEALAKVSQMKRVPLALARALGLQDDAEPADAAARPAATRRSTCRAGGTRSSTFRTRCCSRGS